MASWKKAKMAGPPLVRVFASAGPVADGDDSETNGVANVAVAAGKRRDGIHELTYWSPYLAMMSAWKLSSKVSSNNSV